LPGRTATLLDPVAAAWPAPSAPWNRNTISLKVAAPLVQQVNAQPSDSVIVASGTSCRHQLEHLTPIHPKHMAELLADALA
jgi:Fe-S oxidoreductase